MSLYKEVALGKWQMWWSPINGIWVRETWTKS